MYDCIGGGTSGLFERTTQKNADYVGQKYGGAIRYAVKNLKEKEITLPQDLKEKPTATEKLVYSEEVKEIVKEKRRMKQDLEKLYSVIWGKCSPFMKAKVRTTQDYDNMKDKLGSITLMKEI